MSNPWASGHRASVLFPPSLAAGKEQSHITPDPTDPNTQLSVAQFPLLSPKMPTARPLAASTKARSILSTPTVSTVNSSSPDIEMVTEDLSRQRPETRYVNSRSVVTVEKNPQTETSTVLPPKTSSPSTPTKLSPPPPPLSPLLLLLVSLLQLIQSRYHLPLLK
ncbi:hypothetical protein Bca52824_017942 [Brassica carinata]|uniref:Uncharacterized protein n=1 Tax=Brassica carinata TaxID=52824 RepID=A0A8X7VQ00_BRACI|nr:hypothetical protein Bca52824_017942 [Brassica carinata]